MFWFLVLTSPELRLPPTRPEGRLFRRNWAQRPPGPHGAGVGGPSPCGHTGKARPRRQSPHLEFSGHLGPGWCAAGPHPTAGLGGYTVRTLHAGPWQGQTAAQALVAVSAGDPRGSRGTRHHGHGGTEGPAAPEQPERAAGAADGGCAVGRPLSPAGLRGLGGRGRGGTSESRISSAGEAEKVREAPLGAPEMHRQVHPTGSCQPSAPDTPQGMAVCGAGAEGLGGRHEGVGTRLSLPDSQSCAVTRRHLGVLAAHCPGGPDVPPRW